MRRSMAPTLSLISLALMGMAGCAPMEGAAPGSRVAASDGGARQCFDPSRIVNFSTGEAQQLYVRTLGGEVFRINSASCLNTGLITTVSITPVGGMGSRVCAGESVEVATPNPSFGPGRCSARVDRALTEAEVEALPSRYRP